MIASQPIPRLTDRKRDAIVQAAIGEFREHGFNGTSMDRVAAAADVSKRTVYNHFPSKEELFEAILLLMWERSQSPDELAYTPTRPLRDQLLELLAQKMRLLNDASFIDLSRVAMADMMQTPARARHHRQALGQGRGPAALAARGPAGWPPARHHGCSLRRAATAGHGQGICVLAPAGHGSATLERH